MLLVPTPICSLLDQNVQQSIEFVYQDSCPRISVSGEVVDEFRNGDNGIEAAKLAARDVETPQLRLFRLTILTRGYV